MAGGPFVLTGPIRQLFLKEFGMVPDRSPVIKRRQMEDWCCGYCKGGDGIAASLWCKLSGLRCMPKMIVLFLNLVEIADYWSLRCCMLCWIIDLVSRHFFGLTCDDRGLVFCENHFKKKLSYASMCNIFSLLILNRFVI